MTGEVNPAELQLHQNWIRINPKTIAGNVKAIKSAVAQSPTGVVPLLMAVVKANAYGHGFAVTPLLQEAGADAFGVTTLDEALAVEAAAIDPRRVPILLFAPLTNADQARIAVERGYHVTVCDDAHLDLIESAERETGAKAFPHLKVDTGMGRLGLDTGAAVRVAERRHWAGCYTHFARASEKSIAPTLKALATFQRFIAGCEAKGIGHGMRHCANSAAALRLPESHLDMVRIGTLLYGQMPTNFAAHPKGLSDATFQAQARVVFVHDLRPGDTVGYGSEFTAKKRMRAAVVPVGFADGFGIAPVSFYRGLRGVRQMIADRRRPAFVTVQGRKATVLGRIAMQMIVVDVTGFDPAVCAGDIADVPMRRLSANRMPLVYEN